MPYCLVLKMSRIDESLCHDQFCLIFDNSQSIFLRYLKPVSFFRRRKLN